MVKDIQGLGYVDFLIAALLYVALTFIRFTSIACLFPVMKNWGDGLKKEDVVVMTWGGLRGAVGLALALVVFGDADFKAQLELSGQASYHIPDKILFHCSSIVVLTLIVNATSMPKILSYLGMDKVTLSKSTSSS